MRVVDTSVWIEWLIESPLQAVITQEFPTPDMCLVPTIVQLELNKWLTREISETEADRVIAYTQLCQVIELDTPIALQAAEWHRHYQLTTADSIIYATATIHHADLLTCDRHFEGLPKVLFMPK
jgi:predicted nucleic acid-binding protein